MLIVASKPITIALQCSDPPVRLTGTFPPTATLTEVLLHFEQESGGILNVFDRRGEEAVLSVLGREFGITEGSGGGGATTLAGMGVGGNVLIRLGFRKSGPSTMPTTSASSSGISPSSSSASTVTHTAPIIPSTMRAVVTPSPREVPSPVQQQPSLLQSPPGVVTPPSHPEVRPMETTTILSPDVTSETILAPQPLSPPPEILPIPSAIPPGPNNRNRIIFRESRNATPAAASRIPSLYKSTNPSRPRRNSIQHDDRTSQRVPSLPHDNRKISHRTNPHDPRNARSSRS